MRCMHCCNYRNSSRPCQGLHLQRCIRSHAALPWPDLGVTQLVSVQHHAITVDLGIFTPVAAHIWVLGRSRVVQSRFARRGHTRPSGRRSSCTAAVACSLQLLGQPHRPMGLELFARRRTLPHAPVGGTGRECSLGALPLPPPCPHLTIPSLASGPHEGSCTFGRFLPCPHPRSLSGVSRKRRYCK